MNVDAIERLAYERTALDLPPDHDRRGYPQLALRTPEKIALQEGARTLSYRHLVERIDRVSNFVLHGLEVRTGDHAAVMAPNCLEFVEIVCGLAEAGVAAAMVNPRATAEELAFICDDAGARVLFVHASLEELAASTEFVTVERIVVIGPDTSVS